MKKNRAKPLSLLPLLLLSLLAACSSPAPQTSPLPVTTPAGKPTAAASVSALSPAVTTPATVATPEPTAPPTPSPALVQKLPGTSGNYLILCETEAQKQCLAGFVAFKEQNGFTMTVKSVQADVKPGDNEDASVAVQQYLKNMDQELSLEYVLLIGDPYKKENACPQHTGGAIPMRYLYFNSKNHNTRYYMDWYDYENPKNNAYNTPNDLYYAFDINWDADKDGYAGETNEMARGIKKKKPKLLFLLGRIPFSDVNNIQTVLDTTISYEQSRREHRSALLGSYGIWAFYANALSGNLSGSGVDSTTLYGEDESGPLAFTSTYALSVENFRREMDKLPDFMYLMGDTGRYMAYPSKGRGLMTGVLFLDHSASLTVESDTDTRTPRGQDFLSCGNTCAAIMTTREVGFNPKKPGPRIPSLMFTNKTLSPSNEFYASALSLLAKGEVLGAYVFCYLGDPSLQLKS